MDEDKIRNIAFTVLMALLGIVIIIGIILMIANKTYEGFGWYIIISAAVSIIAGILCGISTSKPLQTGLLILTIIAIAALTILIGIAIVKTIIIFPWILVAGIVCVLGIAAMDGIWA